MESAPESEVQKDDVSSDNLILFILLMSGGALRK